MKIKQSVGYRVFSVFNILLMIILGVLFIFPYLNILAESLNDPADTLRGGLTIYPRVFTLQNYKVILSDSDISRAAVVSVSRVVIAVILSILVQFSAAYSLSRKGLMGKQFFVWLFSIPMFISAGQIPLYVQISRMGLLNNFWVYILPGLFSFYNIVIIRTFIQSTIPDGLIESAHLDGANEMQVLFQMVLPLSKPILATVALWIMVAHWNDWTATLLYIRKSSLFTLQYIMMQLVKETERLQKLQQAAIEMGADVSNMQTKVTSESIISAQVMITTIPIICVYPFLQKYFVKGIMMGSIKG